MHIGVNGTDEHPKDSVHRSRVEAGREDEAVRKRYADQSGFGDGSMMGPAHQHCWMRKALSE